MHTKHLVITAAALLSSAPAARAGTVVTQSIEADFGKGPERSTHVWSVDGPKFHLQIDGDHGTTQYIFNGKTLYACGKLDEKQVDALYKDLGPAARKALDSYKEGACQVVPSNFMARFFLSPMASVESVDASDGLRVTLGVKDYKLEAQKPTRQVQGKDCEAFKRTYSVTRHGDDPKAAEASTVVEEEFCQSPAISWRAGLWQEVAKAILRQPTGTPLIAELKKDHAALSGFVLEASAKQSGGGKSGSFQLKTTSIKDEEFAPKLFQTPKGFEVFSPENLELLAEADTKAKAEPGVKKDDATMADFMRSAFFCAIAGQLGCFSK